MCYFNVKKLGWSIKKRKVKEMIRGYHLDFLSIQKVKLREIQEALCHSL